MATLDGFGLEGAKRGSFYEENPLAFESAVAKKEFMEQALQDSPRLSLFLASDPDTATQAAAKHELLLALENAFHLRGGAR